MILMPISPRPTLTLTVLVSVEEGARAPEYAKDGDAGADLFANADVTIQPGGWEVVPTGVSIALPAGWGAFVHPRSGNALRHGVTVLNAPGTVDAGYRGEVGVLVVNHSDRPFTATRGKAIAQLIVQEVGRARFQIVDALPDSERGDDGWGSTGTAGGAA